MPTRPDADPAIKYQAEIDLARRNSSHTLLHELAVSSGRSVLSILEVGCSSGYLGASLVAKGHRVTGIEPDPVAADAAAGVLHAVWRGGLEDFLDAHPDARFDVLLLGDVLEHMLDPAATLRRALRQLAPDGSVAISLPNVAHGAVRAMLLQGLAECVRCVMCIKTGWWPQRLRDVEELEQRVLAEAAARQAAASHGTGVAR